MEKTAGKQGKFFFGQKFRYLILRELTFLSLVKLVGQDNGSLKKQSNRLHVEAKKKKDLFLAGVVQPLLGG